MGEIIQNFEHAHPNSSEEEIADDVDIVEKKVGKIHMNEIENVITNYKVNNSTDK